MAERLSFTLTGRDELSRVLNGAGSSADRLRLRLANLSVDANGNLRNLQGTLVSTADAHRRLDRTVAGSRTSFTSVSDAAGKLGEKLKANLISLAPAAIPASAALAGAAAQVATQFGAVAVAAAAYGLALGPQVKALGEAVQAQDKYKEAVQSSGKNSAEAVKAQVEYQQALAALPPATREAAVAVGLLKDNYQDWSDSLSGDVMGPFTKGIAVANALLPKTSGLVKGASTQFDRLITMVGGAISTPGFDGLTRKFTDFSDRTMTRSVSKLTEFLAKVDTGQVGGGIQQFLDYARANGPAVWDTLQNVGDALLNVLQAGSDVGVGMLDVINALSGIVSAVPPDAIAGLLQLAIAIKAVRLAAVGTDAARAAMLALGLQVSAMRTAAAAAPGPIRGVTAAIGGLSKGAKLALAGTGIGLLLIALGSLADRGQKAAPDVDKLTTSLGELARTGKVSGEAARAFGSDLSGLADSLRTLSRPSNLDKTQQFLTGLIGMDSTPVKNAKEALDGVDKALANMVTGGKADLAAQALDNVIANLRKQGFTAKEVRAQLDDYKSALAGQRLEQELAAQSMGLFGAQAQRTQAALAAQKQSADGLRQSIQALNDVQRAGLGGMIGFEAAIDAATKAGRENAGVLSMQGGKLSLNTEKQRNAAQSLSDLASKTDEAAAANREATGSWSGAIGIYERGRAKLVETAMQMGLTKQQAQALAAQILKTPSKTAMLKGDMRDLQDKINKAKGGIKSVPPSKLSKLQGNLSDLERKVRDAKASLKSVPPSKRSAMKGDIAQLEGAVRRAKAALASLKDRTVTVTTVQRTRFVTMGKKPPGPYASGYNFGNAGGLLKRASGGPIPGYPDGGRVRGPGSATSDSILMWGSNGEYMVKAASVAKYGLKFMEDLNAGKVPIPSGRAAAPGRPAAAPSAPVSTGSGQQVTYNVYPRSSVIDASDLRLIQRQEEARQRVGRPR